MVLGLVVGIFVGAGGTVVIQWIRNGPKRLKDDPGAAGGSAEAAALLMPGAASMKDLRISLESSSSFVSALLFQLWPQLNKIGIKIVKETVEPMLAEKLPRAFQGTHIETLDFGNQPIQLENFLVYPVNDGTLSMELEINWNSSCDILIAGLPGGTTVGVKSIKLRSRLVIVCRPILDAVPVVSSAQVAFINHPYLDLDFTGLLDVADWGNVRPKVDQGIKDGLSSLVLPKRMFVKVDPKCDFIQAYQRPIGVLRVKLVKGRHFPIKKRGFIKDIPDMYCIFEFGDQTWQSSVVQNQVDPSWNESIDFVLADYGQVLDIKAMDKDRIMNDEEKGSLKCSAVKLLKGTGTQELALACTKKGQSIPKVTLECQLLPFCKDIASVTSEEVLFDKALKGLLVVFVTKVTQLPVPKEEAASFVKVKVGDKEFQTATVKYDPEAAAVAAEAAKAEDGEPPPTPPDYCLNPQFNAVFEIPMDASAHDSIVFELMNGKKSLGTHHITQDLFLIMKDEINSTDTNIGGAILHCGVQVLGIESANDKKSDVGSDENV